MDTLPAEMKTLNLEVLRLDRRIFRARILWAAIVVILLILQLVFGLVPSLRGVFDPWVFPLAVTGVGGIFCVHTIRLGGRRLRLIHRRIDLERDIRHGVL